MRPKLTATTFFCLAITGTLAQTNKFVDWNSLQLPVILSRKWQLQNDISYRTMGLSTKAYQYTFRSGLRYYLNNNLSITAGIAEFHTRTAFEKTVKEFTREFRIWQEIAVESNLSATLKISNRFRLEERHFYASSQKKGFEALRGRFRIGLSKKVSPNYIFTLSNELMGQTNNKSVYFQQNRLGLSFAFPFSKKSMMQTGYIWSYRESESIHYAIITFQKNFNLNEHIDHNRKK